MIRALVRHPNAANLLMVLMIVSGLVALSRLNTQFFPTLTVNVITVIVTWPGATATDIEASILQRIEPELRTINGVQKLISEASEGSGGITIEFADNTNMQMALGDVESTIRRIQNLPEEMEDPLIQHIIFYEEVSRILVFGPFSELVLADIAQTIRTDLLDRGIDRVLFTGRRDPEIRIEVEEATLRRLNLTLSDIAQRIRRTAFDQPLGDFGSQLTGQVRIDAGVDYAAALSDVLIVASPTGDGIYLNEIATLHNDVNRHQQEVFVAEQRAIELIIERVPTASSLEASAILNDYLAEKQGTWPASLHVLIYDTRIDLINQRIEMLLRNGLSGLVIILLLLFIFLETRITFWIAMGIPVALCATAGVMFLMDQTINMLSLFGMIMALGIVVDDAIVVGEHADRLATQGLNPIEAAQQGAEKMSIPVIAGALTTISSFFPLLLIGGIIGKIIEAIPLVIIAMLSMSLFECFFVLPSHMRSALTGKAKHRPMRWRQRFDRVFDRFRFGFFRRVVEASLSWRYTTVVALLSLLIVSVGLIASNRVPFVFFSGPESEHIMANVRFAPGTPRSHTRAQLREMFLALTRTEDAVTQGQRGLIRASVMYLINDHSARMNVELIEGEQRAIRTSTFIRAWRQEIEALPGIERLVIRSRIGGPSGRDIDIRLSGGNAATLKQASEQMIRVLASFEGTSAIDDDLPYGKTESVLSLTPLGRSLGFTHADVARQIRASLEGIIVDRFARDEDEVVLRLLLSDADQNDDILQRLSLRSPRGGEAALVDIVDIEQTQGFSIIRRENGIHEVTITADVDESITNAGILRLTLPHAGFDRIAETLGIDYRFAGRAEERSDTFSDMMTGGLLALISLYIILAWAFGSYTQPLVILAIIPFGLMGAVVGHYVLGFSLTIISLIGLLGLSGVLVNDSVILITTINRYVQENTLLEEVIVKASVERLRPVILTSLTTIGGLFPLLFETSLQAQFLIPMVITLVFGLSTATVLVLVLVPSLVMIQEDVGRLLRRRPLPT